MSFLLPKLSVSTSSQNWFHVRSKLHYHSLRCALWPLSLKWLSAGMGWTVSSKFICWNPDPPVPQNVILFGDRVFPEVIKLPEVIKTHEVFRGALIQYDWCLTRKGTFGHRGKMAWKSREKTAIYTPGWGAQPDPSLTALWWEWPCWRPDFRLAASTTMRQQISIFSAPQSMVLC